MSGVLGTTIGFGVGASAQASVDSATAKSVTANAANAANAATAYSGGHLMAADPSGGYWTVNWVGVIASHGGALLFGSPSLSGIQLSKPIVDMAATPDGQGYWLVGSDGGVFSYGDAKFYGSAGATHLNRPVVGIAATPDGQGYWLVGSDGGIFTFGDAQFYGSAGATHLNRPVVGMAATSDGQGYWLVASDGGIFTFGDAQFYGSLGGSGNGVVGIIISPPTPGYTLVKMDGTADVLPLAPTAGGRTTATPPTTAPPSTTTTAPPSTTTTTPPSKTTTTTTTPPSKTTTTTTTPPPVASTIGTIPDVPASLGAPTKLIFDDEFAGGSLNKAVWTPSWFGDANTQNGTVMKSANLSVDANGLELTLGSDSTGAIASSNPSDGQAGHSGFQMAPSPGKPVYVEYRATLPSSGGQIANWPGLWLTGQNWPLTGEIDVMEGFGTSQFHIEIGPAGSTFGNPGFENPGGVGGTTAGTHSYGVLWSTSGVTFVYDGVVVGSETASLTGPMYLVMENSLGSPALLGATMTVRDVRVWQ